MNIVANGRPRTASDGATIEDFVHEMGLDTRFVIVEYNGEPLKRDRFGDTSLSDGDRIELVKAVAGG